MKSSPRCRSSRDIIPVIAIGAQRSQTAAAYKLLDDIHYEGTRTAEAMQTALCDPARAHTLPETMYNAFERVILPENPRTAEIREKLMDLGAEAALLSGSGAAVYGLFREEEKAGRRGLGPARRGASGMGNATVGAVL